MFYVSARGYWQSDEPSIGTGKISAHTLISVKKKNSFNTCLTDVGEGNNEGEWKHQNDNDVPHKLLFTTSPAERHVLTVWLHHVWRNLEMTQQAIAEVILLEFGAV